MASEDGSDASNRWSTDLSGSVFLISSDGDILKLPMPSNSPRDPLNWSKKRRFLAINCLTIFAGLGLTIVEAPSLLFLKFYAEFLELASVFLFIGRQAYSDRPLIHA